MSMISSSSSPSLFNYQSAHDQSRQLEEQASNTIPSSNPPLARQLSFEDDDIHYACRMGNLEKVKYYIANKSSVRDHLDDYGNLPLYYACLCGHHQVVEYLLSIGGVDIEGRDRCWWNALDGSIRLMLRRHEEQFPEMYQNIKTVHRSKKPRFPSVIKQFTDDASSASSSSSSVAPPSSSSSVSNPAVAFLSPKGKDFNYSSKYIEMYQQMHETEQDAAQFHETLLSLVAKLSPVLLNGTRGLNKLMLKFRESALLPIEALQSGQCFLDYYVSTLRTFLHDPHVINTGLRLLALLCLNCRKCFDYFLVKQHGFEFVEQFVMQFLTPPNTQQAFNLNSAKNTTTTTTNNNNNHLAPPSLFNSSSSVSSAAAAKIPQKCDLMNDPDFLFTFLSSIEHLLTTASELNEPQEPNASQRSGRNKRDPKPSNVSVSFQTLLPFLLRTLKSFMDFPPIVSQCLLTLRSILLLAPMQLMSHFMFYQGIQLCISAYLAYLKLPSRKQLPFNITGNSINNIDTRENNSCKNDRLTPIDEVDNYYYQDGDEKDELELNEQFFSALKTSPQPPINNDSTVPVASVDTDIDSNLTEEANESDSQELDQERDRQFRQSRSQIPRYAISLLQAWMSIHDSHSVVDSSRGKLFHSFVPPESQPSSGKNSKTGVELLQEAYSFLRVPGFADSNPYLNVGLAYAPFLNNQTMADMVFELDGENGKKEYIFGHKIILLARSEYWKIYFTNELTNNNRNNLENDPNAAAAVPSTPPSTSMSTAVHDELKWMKEPSTNLAQVPFSRQVSLASIQGEEDEVSNNGKDGANVDSIHVNIGTGSLDEPLPSSASSTIPDRTLTCVRVFGYSETSFLTYLEYLYIGLSSPRLKDMLDVSRQQADDIETQMNLLKQRLRRGRTALSSESSSSEVNSGNDLNKTKKHGESSNYVSGTSHGVASDGIELDSADVERVMNSNVLEYLDLLRLCDEFQCDQLRIMVEFMIYDDSTCTRLINTETIWNLLTASLLFHAPLLEYHCLKFLVKTYESHDEQCITHAASIRKCRKQVLRSYGFL